MWLLGRLASLSGACCYSLSLVSDSPIQVLKPQLRGTAQEREEVGDTGMLQLRLGSQPPVLSLQKRGGVMRHGGEEKGGWRRLYRVHLCNVQPAFGLPLDLLALFEGANSWATQLMVNHLAPGNAHGLGGDHDPMNLRGLLRSNVHSVSARA